MTRIRLVGAMLALCLLWPHTVAVQEPTPFAWTGVYRINTINPASGEARHGIAEIKALNPTIYGIVWMTDGQLRPSHGGMGFVFRRQLIFTGTNVPLLVAYAVTDADTLTGVWFTPYVMAPVPETLIRLPYARWQDARQVRPQTL